MIHRPRREPAPHIYPAHEWHVTERDFIPSLLSQGENIFYLSNGDLGMLGCLEEG